MTKKQAVMELFDGDEIEEEEAQLPDWYMEWYFPEAIRYCLEHSWCRKQDEQAEGPFWRIDGQVSTGG